MKMPLHIAQKLQQLQQAGQLISGSLMRHAVVDKMLDDGILLKKQLSKTKSQVYLANAGALQDYLHNHFGIGDLDLFVKKLLADDLTRAASVQISGDSKLRNIRTFSGFPVNVYEPVQCRMQGQSFMLQPLPGCFTFIQDYNNFIPDPAITIVGVENAENFSHIEKQAYLFKDIQPLFVSRYPQSNDLVKWLKAIPNPYLHFGDLDFEGINIYLHEYKSQLGERGVFFIPEQTEEFLLKFGNRALFNKQLSSAADKTTIAEKPLRELVELLHLHKKVLEQEVFIERIASS